MTSLEGSNKSVTSCEKTRSTAGIIIIGDEILKGHVADTNSNYLCQHLYSVGVCVKKITVINDDENIIAEEVFTMSNKYSFVFTSGGIGPTHDDVTYTGVARAFNEKLITNSELLNIFEKNYSCTEHPAAVKMAMVPESSVIHYLFDKNTGKTLDFPVISVKNVYVLPGIPTFLKTAFENLIDALFNCKSKYHLIEMYLNKEELPVASTLNKAANLFKNKVIIGSYPEVDHNYYKLKLTLESDSEDEVQCAYAYLKDQLPEGSEVHFEKDSIVKAVEQVYGLLDLSDNSFTKAIKQAVSILEETFHSYDQSEICVCFNGGKDCTALLHLTYAVAKKLNLSLKNLQAFYVNCYESFPEVEQFIKQTVKRSFSSILFSIN